MADKRFSGAPFGSQSARFDVSAIHPDNKKPGTYTEVPYCRKATSEEVRRLGPGTYEAAPGDFSPLVLQRKAAGPGWKREEETKRLSQMPHFLFKETLERNHLLRQSLGPGRYNMKSFVEILEEKPASELGVCSTRETRFKEDQKICNPGPGTYGNPYKLTEERAAKSASSKGLMENEKTINRLPQSAGSGLGPGTYNVKNFVAESLKHRAGKRGLYDLSISSRDQLIYGHFGSQHSLKLKEYEPGQYPKTSFTEELGSGYKKKHGTFGKIAQYPEVPTERMCRSTLAHCPRPSKSPGPGFYDVKPSFTPRPETGVPFLCSAKRFERKSCSLLSGNMNPVGVGRYDITKELHGKTATCFRAPFLSKSGRSFGNPTRYKFLEERMQPKNIHTATVRSPHISLITA
ncbi:ciliary microtubule-associated protein 2 [Pelobates fuscus]|uniref:ciliary microtubule-associated protein 2 n=1 Tax=Pelobates fuscus TaxID=191477 RepID=UPI002FE4C16E